MVIQSLIPLHMCKHLSVHLMVILPVLAPYSLLIENEGMINKVERANIRNCFFHAS